MKEAFVAKLQRCPGPRCAGQALALVVELQGRRWIDPVDAALAIGGAGQPTDAHDMAWLKSRLLFTPWKGYIYRFVKKKKKRIKKGNIIEYIHIVLNYLV